MMLLTSHLSTKKPLSINLQINNPNADNFAHKSTLDLHLRSQVDSQRERVENYYQNIILKEKT